MTIALSSTRDALHDDVVAMSAGPSGDPAGPRLGGVPDINVRAIARQRQHERFLRSRARAFFTDDRTRDTPEYASTVKIRVLQRPDLTQTQFEPGCRLAVARMAQGPNTRREIASPRSLAEARFAAQTWLGYVLDPRRATDDTRAQRGMLAIRRLMATMTPSPPRDDDDDAQVLSGGDLILAFRRLGAQDVSEERDAFLTETPIVDAEHQSVRPGEDGLSVSRETRLELLRRLLHITSDALAHTRMALPDRVEILLYLMRLNVDPTAGSLRGDITQALENTFATVTRSTDRPGESNVEREDHNVSGRVSEARHCHIKNLSLTGCSSSQAQFFKVLCRLGERAPADIQVALLHALPITPVALQNMRRNLAWRFIVPKDLRKMVKKMTVRP